jgi:small redox-active disulfide protein 2
MITIEVFGGECQQCEQVEKNSKEALAQLGVKGEVIEVADQNEIVEHGITVTPALVINDEVESMGRIPEPTEIIAWLQEIT